MPHPGPAGPPRRRANKRRGHGTFANDRPPVLGVVGRQSGEVSLEVIGSADGETLTGFVGGRTEDGGSVYTDEWGGYSGVSGTARAHATVCHGSGEWARDGDGGGVREVHCNTLEGVWAGLRNFLRPFRGVSKHYLGQYVAVFQWAHNLKGAVPTFLGILLGVTSPTPFAP